MPPRVSVVVPIYNVEAHLAECLESIARQSLPDIEVVMVDDGSTDNSGTIARQFAAADPRFRLLRQDNRGLGAARNAGADLATGDYLTFADSDDLIPEHAYELMVATLDETGSDFASGNVRRLTPFGIHQSPMHRKPFERTRLCTHVTRDELLLYDRLAPNKMWRRTFWDAHRLRFPEGVLYEDIPVTIPAHFLATSVDVLSECTYLWRQRAGGEQSITERRTEVKAVTDRVAAVEHVSRFLARQGLHDAKLRFDTVALGSDIRIFLNVLDETDGEFHEAFLRLVGGFLDQAAPGAVEQLTAIARLKYHLVRRRDIDRLVQVVRYEKYRMAETATVRSGRHWYADYPFRDDPVAAVPAGVYRLGTELALRTAISSLRWHDGKLRVEGTAYVDLVDLPSRWSSLKVAVLALSGTRRRRLVRVRTVRRPEVNGTAKRARQAFDWAGYSFEIDPRALRVRGRWVDGVWSVHLGVLSRGVLRHEPLAGPAHGAPERPAAFEVEPGVFVQPQLFDRRLTLRVSRPSTVATSAIRDGDALAIAGWTTATARPPTRLTLRRRTGSASLRYPLVVGEPDGTGRRPWQVHVPLSDVAGHLEVADEVAHTEQTSEGADWDARIGRSDDGFRLALAPEAEERRFAHAGREIAVHRTRYGKLTVALRTFRPVVDEVAWTGRDTVVLAGSYAEPTGVASVIALRARGRLDEHAFPMRRDGDRWTAELPVTAVETLAGPLPLKSGTWDVLVRAADGGPGSEPGRGPGSVVKLDHRILDAMPAERTVRGKLFRVGDIGYDSLAVRVESDLAPAERGHLRQHGLQTAFYPAAMREPLRDEVLFDSYTGKQYSDSPRAICEHLARVRPDLRLRWVVRDQQVNLPDGVEPVPLWSHEWYAALARSRYVVTNGHLPQHFRRRAGQLCVQTWHGTPLKRIGFDIESVRFASNYHERLRVEVPNWSHLVSPNRFSTPILRRAFGFDGELLEVGYPRNDLLYRPDLAELARQVRDRVGVPAGKRVALYLPTWRDDSFYAPGKYRLDLRLDLDEARAKLSDEWALLVRRHPNIVDRVPGAGDGFVHDVSGYPDVGELYAASDVLVTDYSSAMFDFAGLRRPMLFFTYDLDDYRDRLRGFYFDFGATAPGPLLATSGDVVAALQSLDEVESAYAERYAAFVAAYCDLDDGHATERLVDAVFATERQP